MAIITLPAEFIPRSTSLRLATNQRVKADAFQLSEQALDLLGDRWLLSCELPDSSQADGAWREAFIGSMRGQTNVVALWHMMRPQPRGTLRGTLTLNGNVSQGASSIAVSGGIGQALATLKAGDMLGVGGLLLMVQSDCAADASGDIIVPITNRVRKALTTGAAIAWYKPTAYFRLLSDPSIVYFPGMASGPSFEFGEVVSP